MIDFKYHLVSIIAIFFALATGIALGAGPLAGPVSGGLSQQVNELRKDNQQLRSRMEDSRVLATFNDDYAQAQAPKVLKGALKGQTLVLVQLPGGDANVVSALSKDAKSAGATVAATVTVSSKWTDADQESVLDNLAADLVSEGTTLPQGGGYARAATVLADAMLTVPGEKASSTTKSTADVLAAFSKAGLIKVSGNLDEAADGAVLVTGDPVADDSNTSRTLTALLDFVKATDRFGLGSTLVGPPVAAGDRGLIGEVRGDSAAAKVVSTVDTATCAAGRTVAVLAEREQLSKRVGHYGDAAGAQATMPK